MARAGANMAGAGVVAIGGTGGAAAEVAVPAVAGGVVLAGAGAAVTAHGVAVVANSGRLLAEDIAHFNSADEGSTATQSAATTKSQTDQDVAKEIAVDYNKHPEAAKHIDDAQAAGKPEVVTVDRGNAPSQRAAAQSGQQKVAGKQIDEYPPAFSKEGGAGASTRPINPSDNMGAGASMGNQLRGVADGEKVRIKTINKPED
jgi:filamentous hemagglutinin